MLQVGQGLSGKRYVVSRVRFRGGGVALCSPQGMV